jgi:hypothetical protein
VAKIALASGALAAALALAACGGGGGETLSRSQFIAKADALCREANKAPPPAPAQDAAQAVRNAQQEVRLRTRLRDQLGKLEPPKELKSLFASYQSQTTAIIAGFRQEVAAARARDVRRFNQIDARLAGLQARRAKVAGQIGFKVCGGAVAPTDAADPAIVRADDAACTAANRAQQTANPQPSGPTDAAAIAKSGPGVLAAQRRALGVIRGQKPAPRIKAVYDQFTSGFAGRVDLTAGQITAAKARDTRKLQALFNQDQQLLQRREAPAAQKLGFEVCGILGENGV